MHMGAITMSYSLKGSKATVTAATKVLDAAGVGVPSATVTGRWTLPNGTTTNQQAVSSSSGTVSFKVTSTKGTYQFCVTSVTKTGWVYAPSQNVETCDTLTTP